MPFIEAHDPRPFKWVRGCKISVNVSTVLPILRRVLLHSWKVEAL